MTPEDRPILDEEATGAVGQSTGEEGGARVACQQSRRGAARAEILGDALPSLPLHDCTERLSTQSAAGVGGLGGASGGGGRFEGARRQENAPPEIRPTIRRRLNALAIMVSDGCA